jgi:hypothetical protein
MARMALLRRILDFFLGERGPTDIVRTRSGDAVCFRLPNQRHNHERGTGWLAMALVFGVPFTFVSFLIVLFFPPEQRNSVGGLVFVAVILVIISAVIGKWRFVWHYELSLTPDILAVNCISSFRRQRLTTIALASVEQLTVVRQLRKSLLQAESVADAPRLILQDQDYDLLVRLAQVLAIENASLNPDRPALRVAVETPLGVQAERSAPPLNSKVVLSGHDTGITLDFHLAEDPRYHARRRAWRTFEAGIFILIGTLITFVACEMRAWRDMEIFLGVPFVVGLICLVTAASQSWATWQDTRADDDLRQLSIVGNLLIRTSRDHRKQVWYRDEIRAIVLEEKIEHFDIPSGGSTPGTFMLYCLHLVVELHNGDKAILTRRASPHPTDDYRPKAEMEWIATQLRQALFAAADAPTPTNEDEPLAHAIRTAASYAVKSEPET